MTKFQVCLCAVVAGLAAFATWPAKAAVPTVDPLRAVVISGVIQGDVLEPLALRLATLAHDPTGKPVDIVLDSPGGSVGSGFRFLSQLDALRAQGTAVRCFVPTLAASMAFQILVHCDERYVLGKAFLLWHGVRTVVGGGMFSPGEVMTAVRAADLARDMAALDRVVLKETTEALGIDAEVVAFHFAKETLHLGADLAELAPDFADAYDYIPGLLDTLADKRVMHTAVPANAATVWHPNEIVYLWGGG